MADSTRLPSQCVLPKELILPAIHAILSKAAWMSRLRLNFSVDLFLCSRFFLRYGLRQALKVFLRKLELAHNNQNRMASSCL